MAFDWKLRIVPHSEKFVCYVAGDVFKLAILPSYS